MVNLKPDEFGLKVPSNVKESKQYNTNRVKRTICLTESELERMIDKSVRRIIKERRNRILDEAIGRSLHKLLRERTTKIVRL